MLITFFNSSRFLCLCLLIVCILASFDSHSVKSSSPVDPPVSMYSKSGSDSISLIVFGEILVKNTAENKEAKPTIVAPSTSAPVKKDKNKDKFSIKSTDKLKTNSPLY